MPPRPTLSPPHSSWAALGLARSYCAAHPRTLVLFTPDEAPHRLETVGEHDGVQVEPEGQDEALHPKAKEAEA